VSASRKRVCIPAVRELLSSARAVGGLRFTAMTVFLTAIGGLSYGFYMANLFDDERCAIAVAAGVLSLFFAFFEIALSYYLIRYWRAIEALVKDDADWRHLLAHRENRWLLGLMRTAFVSISLLSVAWWAWNAAPFLDAQLARLARGLALLVPTGTLVLALATWHRADVELK
jgi:hypothetical protein